LSDPTGYRLHRRGECPSSVTLLDGPPPVLPRLVPLDGVDKALLEGVSWLPSETADFRRVDRVPQVMSGPVVHSLDPGRVETEGIEDPICQFDVGQLGVSTDVVDLPLLSLVHEHMDGGAVIFDVQPISLVAAIP